MLIFEAEVVIITLVRAALLRFLLSALLHAFLQFGKAAAKETQAGSLARAFVIAFNFLFFFHWLMLLVNQSAIRQVVEHDSLLADNQLKALHGHE